MIDVFNFHKGELPLLISVPHDGCHLSTGMRERMTPAGRALPDTDWHVTELYDFARELGASMLVANYSRYVVDLNRSARDEDLYPGKLATGLCPVQTFAGDAIYADLAIDEKETRDRVAAYWQPYHDRLKNVIEAMRDKFGYALLWDAHSITSIVPRLFDGELPELNIGTNGGLSCAAHLENAVRKAAEVSSYSVVLNGRFQGGFITRHYGDPDNNVHAVQLEIAQRAYMDESTGVFDAAKASTLRYTLKSMLDEFTELAKRE